MEASPGKGFFYYLGILFLEASFGDGVTFFHMIPHDLQFIVKVLAS